MRLYKICTDDYGNDKYLAMKYIRFFINDMMFEIWCLSKSRNDDMKTKL